MEEPLKDLREEVNWHKSSFIPVLLKSRDKIQAAIADAAKKRSFAASRSEQRKLYDRIIREYEIMAEQIDKIIKRGVVRTSTSFRKVAKNDLKQSSLPSSSALIPKFSDDLVSDWFREIGIVDGGRKGVNATPLAAVKTTNMARSDIRQIRTVVSSVLAEAALTGLTSAQISKAMREAVSPLSDTKALDSWKFIDKSGKRWTKNNYFNMVARTVPATISREAYKESMISAGVELFEQTGKKEDLIRFDLAEITGGSQPCPICARWRGVIISISGANKDFPSLQDALDAGVWHPNCVCSHAYVDMDLEKSRVESQSKLKNPSKPTPEEWNRYADEVQARAKDDVKTDADQGVIKSAGKKDSSIKAQATVKRK